MSTSLPPVPHQAPISNQSGIIPPVWSDWFKQALKRMGGPAASSNSEIDSQLATMTPKLIPTGAMLDFGGSSAPSGFLLCDGSAVSRTTYAALFAVVGTAFGVGDGSTTFNVPASGTFAVSKNGGTFSTVGSTGGAESVTLPNHLHSVNITTGAPSATANMTSGATAVASSAHTHSVSGNTGNPTTSPSIATLPPYVVVQRIIKT